MWSDSASGSCQYGFDLSASPARAELTGALKAIEASFRPIEIRVSGDYLVKGCNEWMPRWETLSCTEPKSSLGAGRGKLKHKDLWASMLQMSASKSFTAVRAPLPDPPLEFLAPANGAPTTKRFRKGNVFVSKVFQHDPLTAAFFSDGSFAHGKGAWAWCSTNGKHLTGRAAQTHSPLTAELRGILDALLAAYHAGIRKAVIYCDCLSAVSLIRSPKHHPRKGSEAGRLIGEIRRIMGSFNNASVMWVRGHRGILENTIVDRHAREIWTTEFR